MAITNGQTADADDINAELSALASDISALDGAAVKKTGDQSVAGVKTFTSIPVLPASNPTTDNQAVRKAYVDNKFNNLYVAGTDYTVVYLPTARTTTAESYTIRKGAKIGFGGTVRVSFKLKTYNSSTTVYGRIYRNGVAVGTIRSTNNERVFTEDISGCVAGDAIQIYACTSNPSYFAEISEFLVQVASCYPTGITTVDG